MRYCKKINSTGVGLVLFCTCSGARRMQGASYARGRRMGSPTRSGVRSVFFRPELSLGNRGRGAWEVQHEEKKVNSATIILEVQGGCIIKSWRMVITMTEGLKRRSSNIISIMITFIVIINTIIKTHHHHHHHHLIIIIIMRIIIATVINIIISIITP